MSFTSSTRSRGDVYDADAFGKPRPLALYAMLLVGSVGSRTGSATRAQASSSVRPVDEPRRCVKTTRTLDVSTARRSDTTLGRRPAGRSGVRRMTGAGTHVRPSHTST